MKKRVVITGVGVIACNGEGKEEYWKALKEGRHGFRKITLFDTSKFNIDIAGEVPNFDPTKYLGTKGLRTLDRSTKLLLSAAKLAIDDSQLKISEENTHDIGVSVGCTFGSIDSINKFDLVALHEGPRYTNPAFFPNTVINSPPSQVSIWFKIKGFNTTISSGFTSSIDSIRYAYDFIKMGRANIVFTGGVEELCEPTFYGFHEMGYLSGSKEGEEWISCPFDKRRNGITFGEGACLLALEEYEHAKKRGVEILAEVLGFGSYFDSYRLYKHRLTGIGLRMAIQQALNSADIDVSEINLIYANANSSIDADQMEMNAINDVFGNKIHEIPITAVKSIVGESYSASGSFAVSASLGCIKNKIISPTISSSNNFINKSLKTVANFPRAFKGKNILINNAGPNGNYNCMIIRDI